MATRRRGLPIWELARLQAESIGLIWRITGSGYAWEELLVWLDGVEQGISQRQLDQLQPSWIDVYGNGVISDHIIVAQIGDADPIIYGGGVVFLVEGDHEALDYTYGLESEGDPEKLWVYQFSIDPVNIEDHVKTLVGDDYPGFRDSLGLEERSIREYLARAREGPLARALMAEDLISYWGGQNLDSYPIQLTPPEIALRWGLDPEDYIEDEEEDEE
jgi:hypothetical protein